MPSLQDSLLIFFRSRRLVARYSYVRVATGHALLDTLQDNQVPVILCSSKTAAEMLDIQQDLGLEGLPFIAENGAVIQPDVRWETGQRHIRG